MSFIPRELTVCPQWLLWRKVWLQDKQRWSKVPLSARTGHTASITEPANWTTYEAASAAFKSFGAAYNIQGLGFALGFGSGITGIDLDGVFDPQGSTINYKAVELAKRFESYTEYSPSRTGLHILCRADIPDGRRTDFVEIYGQGRYFTVTGEPFGDPLPVADKQLECEALIADIARARAASAPTLLDWSAPQKYADNEIWQMAATANNGQKFTDLWQGNWQQYYQSQSEADFALIDIIAFYSDSPEQVRRAFLQSGLGQRSKAVDRPDYVSGMIARSFDRKPPLVTVPVLPAPVVVNAPTVLADDDAEDKAERAHDPYIRPPGLVGKLADFIYAQSPYPMKEAALAAALAFVAGICGRQYQFNAKGLNLYLMVLANTGSGKEAMSTGIGKLLDAICNPPPLGATPDIADLGFPSARAFRGPAELTGRGIVRMFSKGKQADTLSAFCVLNEFAYVLAQMADTRGTNTGMIQFKRALLDMYMKSSEGNTYAGTMNADKDADVAGIASPALTILCESTPGRLYACLNDDLIADGMLPRMILFESEGYGVYNPGHASVQVDNLIKQELIELCKQVFTLRQSGDTFQQVKTTPEGAAKSEEFRIYCRDKLVNSEEDAHKELWNRAHLNAERVAALVAIGVDRINPTVTADMIYWAAQIIRRQIVLLIGKFKRGEVGLYGSNDEKQQHDDVMRLIRKFMEMSPDDLLARNSHAKYADARRAGVIPYRYIMQLTSTLRSFKDDKRGHAAALSHLLEHMRRAGTLSTVRLDGHEGQHYKWHN